MSNIRSHFKRDSKTQDQRSLQYKQCQTLKGKVPNQDNNSRVEFQTTRENSREDTNPRVEYKGRSPKHQEENLREESQRVKHNTKTLGRGERKNPEICEPPDAN